MVDKPHQDYRVGGEAESRGDSPPKDERKGIMRGRSKPTLQMWHIYTMEYYSAVKRNEIELFVIRWMDLASVIQSEVSQKEKNKYRVLAHIYGI